MTRNEARNIRAALDGLMVKIADTPAEINAYLSAIRKWTPGAYAIGDVRMHEGIPYKCVQAHDSTDNSSWTPDITPALWMQYHGTSADTARPWIAPTGSHDMYKVDEYMVWEDGKIYRCVTDTVYSPASYGSAWAVVE